MNKPINDGASLLHFWASPIWNRTVNKKPNGQLTTKQLNSRWKIIHSIWEWLGYILAISVRSLCLSKSWQDAERVVFHGEISPISARCRKSRGELNEMWKTNKYHGEIAEISPWHLLVSQTSRWCLDKSWRDGGYLAAISPRFRMSRTSWRDLYNLGVISAISARWKISCRDLAEI